MSTVQTTYPNTHDQWLDGQIADTSRCDVDSLSAEGVLAFGRAVRQGTGAREVLQGIARRRLSQLSAAINDSVTTIPVDAIAAAEPSIEDGYIIINGEFMRITEVNAGRTSLTAERGARQSAPAGHVDDSVVYFADRNDFRGIAVMDQRVPATAGENYPVGEVASVLWRGDVAVEVSEAVSVGDRVVVATVASGSEEVGQLSAQEPDGTHVPLVNARFISAAAAGAVAVVRLSGPEPGA